MGILFLDSSFCILYISASVAHLLRKEEKDLRGKQLQDLIPAGLSRELSGKLEQSRKEGTDISFETQCPEYPDLGFKFLILSSGDETLMILEDLTGKQAATEARKERLNKARGDLAELESIYTSAPIGLCVLDTGLRYVRINDRLARLNGRPASEHIGRTVQEMAPGLADHAKAIMQEILRTGKPVLDIEFTASDPFKPGITRAWKDHWLPIKDAAGSVVGVNVVMEDITDIKKSEHALRASEERYRTLYDAMSQGVLEFDGSGTLVSWNRAAEHLLNQDLGKMTGRTMQEIFSSYHRVAWEGGQPVPDGEFVSNIVLKTCQSVRSAQARVVDTRDGSYHWVSIDSVPRFALGEGNPCGVFTIFSDITNMKNAEVFLHSAAEELELKVKERTESLMKAGEKLEEQKELLRTIIDNIPVMLVFMNPEGKFQLINREAERIIGWSQEVAQSMDVLSFIYPDPAYRREVADFIEHSQGVWKNFTPVTRSGELLPSSWANIRLPDGSRIGIGIDLRTQKKMKEDLTQLAAAIDQAGEGIMLISAEGMIKYANPAYEKIYGYGRNELAGNSPEILGHDVYTDYQSIIARIRSDGKPWLGHRTRRRKNGETFEANISVSPVWDDSGSIINFVAAVQDVTQEMKLQQQLFQAQKMEAIGTLASGIAHDLKNILTPVLINTEIAMEDISPDNPVYPLLEEILDAARLGKDLVRHILTFSQRTPQGKHPVNISSIIRETMAFLRSSLPATVEIRSIIDDESAEIDADPTQIKQVLMNLGSNAAHAMREKGGILEIHLSDADLDSFSAAQMSPSLRPGSYVRITVRDTGQGMDPETMKHIFDLFFTTKNNEGTGMGLATAKRIVKDHGGAITVESEPGKGSTFTILLPGESAGQK